MGNTERYVKQFVVKSEKLIEKVYEEKVFERLMEVQSNPLKELSKIDKISNLDTIFRK